MKNSTAIASTMLAFARGADKIRDFEVTALNAVPGVGGFYPDLSTLGVEAQMLRPGPATTGTVTVFFKLISYDGLEYIEIQDQIFPGVFVNKGFIWPSSDGTANLTILEEVINAHYVLESTIDGEVVRLEFDPDYGAYLPVDELARAKAMNIIEQRGFSKAS